MHKTYLSKNLNPLFRRPIDLKRNSKDFSCGYYDTFKTD